MRRLLYLFPLIFVIVIAQAVQAVSQPPQLPHIFYGNVTINGQPAPDGTLVEARINNTTVATANTSNGEYLLKVPVDNPDTGEKDGGVDGDIVEFYVNGSYAKSYTFSIGSVTELDLSVSVAGTQAQGTATKDTVAPTITELTPGNDSFVNNTTPTISAVVSDDLSGINAESIQMTLDDTPVQPNYDSDTGTVSYTPESDLTEGQHTVSLNVSDNAGNTAEVSWSFTVDVTPPTISITTPIAGDDVINAQEAENGITITGTVSDEGSGVAEVTVTLSDGTNNVQKATVVDPDTGTWNVSFTSDNLTQLSDGQITVTATATDRAGNQNSDQKQITKDTAAPTVTVDLPDINRSNVNNVEITLTSDEAGNYTITIDDEDPNTDPIVLSGTIGAETTTLTADLSSLSDGKITAKAEVTDAAGNKGQAQDTATKDTQTSTEKTKTHKTHKKKTGGGGGGVPVTVLRKTVILVSDNEADSVLAEYIARLARAPIVKTPWGIYDPNVTAEIKDHSPDKVIIIGGPVAVPEPYEDDLKELNITVERWWGEDRYETNIAVLGNVTKLGLRLRNVVIAVPGNDSIAMKEALTRAVATKGFMVFFNENTDLNKVLARLKVETHNVINVILVRSQVMEKVAERVKERLGKISSEFDVEITAERALEVMNLTRERIAKAEELLANVALPEQKEELAKEMLDKAKGELEMAEKAYEEGKYEEAYEQAITAKAHAEFVIGTAFQEWIKNA